MPPTTMSLPDGTLDLGIQPGDARVTVELPIRNLGRSELRVVIRANAPWLQAPNGQVRVAPGGTASVPMALSTMGLAGGRYQARVELDGNGGPANIPVQLVVRARWTMGAYLILIVLTVSVCIAVMAVARVVVLVR